MKADAFAGGARVLLYGKAGRNGSVRIVKRLLIGGMSRARQCSVITVNGQNGWQSGILRDEVGKGGILAKSGDCG